MREDLRGATLFQRRSSGLSGSFIMRLLSLRLDQAHQ